MNLSLEALKLLRYTGEELHITTTTFRNAGPYGHYHAYLLERQGHGTATVTAREHPSAMQDELRQMLAAYPAPVSVDGAPVRRTPLGQGAPMVIGPGTGTEAPSPSEYRNFSQWHPVTVPKKHRIWAGGVLCQPTVALNAADKTCYTPAGGEDRRWEFADTIILMPMTIISPEDMPTITDTEFKLFLNNTWINHRLPQENQPGNVFTKARLSIEEQVRFTLDRRPMPPLHEGPLYRYVKPSTGNRHNTSRTIIVHGNPLIFPHSLDPRTASLADALYRNEAGHVPVSPHEIPLQQVDTVPALRDLDNSFPTPSGPPPNRVVASISLSYSTSQGTWHTTQADYLALGEAHYPAFIVAENARNRPDLPKAIADSYPPNHQTAGHHEEVQHGIEILAIQAARGSEAAYTEELRRLLDNFRPHSSPPETRVKVTSTDRTLSITARPKPR